MLRHTLLSLRTRRTSLTIIIADIYDERANASIARKKELDKEVTQYTTKLQSVNDDIAILSGVVDELNEQWSEKNVSNKPVTVI